MQVMKTRKNRLQQSVLKRLEAGLPPTRWQRFCLHFLTVWRLRGKPKLQPIMFHLRSVARVFFQGNRKK